jgi:hypothetical protein
MLPPSNSGASASLASPFTRLLPSASSPLSENFRPWCAMAQAVSRVSGLVRAHEGRRSRACLWWLVARCSSLQLCCSLSQAWVGTHIRSGDAARTLIQQRVASSTVGKALRRQSAADTTTSMSFG